MEVEATVSAVVGLRDCVVYGVRNLNEYINKSFNNSKVFSCENLTLFAKVEIPGTEGRAGMVAIPDPERKVDVEKVGGLP